MRAKHRTRGATLVEMAIVLPVLFIMLFGILEFGRAFNIYQTLTNAAREGARYSVAPFGVGQPNAGNLPTPAQIQTFVQTFLAADGLSVPSGNIQVAQTCSGTTACPAVNGFTLQYSQVTVTSPYQFFYFPIGTINITSQAVMRNETN